MGLFYFIVVIFASWLRITPALNMLNGWAVITKQFEQTFKSNLRLPGIESEIRRYCLQYFVIPITTFCILGIAQAVFWHGNYQLGNYVGNDGK